MAGIRFDITGDNSNFLESIKQIQTSVRQTSSVLSELGDKFNINGVTNQIISLTKVIQEEENKIRGSKETIVSLMEEANSYRNRGDNKLFERTQNNIDEETKALEGYISKLTEYRKALDEIMSLNGRSSGARAPMFFESRDAFAAYEELLEKREEIQSKIANFNNEGMTESQSTARIVEMRSELTALNTEINNTELSAAKAASALGENGQKAAEAAVNYYTLTKAVEEQISKVNDLEAETLEAYNSFQASVEINDVEGASNAQAEYENLKESLHSARMELINLQNEQKGAENEFRQFGDTSASLRMQLRETTMELQSLVLQYRQMSAEERNSAQGKEMEEKIEDLTDKAGDLKDALNDVNRAVRESSSDTRAFDSLAGGINVVTSTIGAATGVLAMFGAEEEDLQDIQAKLQASLAISNALTVVQNNLQRESALMIGITTMQKKAAVVAENIETAAKGKNIVVTAAATVAQKAFNAVAKANPYVLLATALITVVGALAAFSIGTRKAKEEQEKLNEQAKQLSETFNSTYSNSLSSTMTKYKQLQAQYEGLRTEHEKTEWIEKNKAGLDGLGVSVRGVSDAERLFKTDTQNVIKAFTLRAQAAAYAAQMADLYKNAMSYKAGDEVDEDTYRNKGLGTGSFVNTKHGFFSDTYTLTQEGADYLNRLAMDKVGKEAEKLAEQQVKLENQAANLLGSLASPNNTPEVPKNPTVNKYEDDAKKRDQKLAELDAKERDERIAQAQRTANAVADAKIAAEENAATRERMEQDRQHELDMQQIDKQADEYRKKNYEAMKARWEAGNTDKTKTWSDTDTAKQVAENGYKAVELTKDQEEEIAALRREKDAEYGRIVENRIKAEEKANAEAIQAYIAQFGGYVQQKQAIYDKANTEICELEAKMGEDTTEETRQAIEAQIELVKHGAEKEVESLNQKFGYTAHALGDFFADVSEKSAKELSRLVKKYKAFLDFREGKKDRDSLKGKFGFTDKELDEIDRKLKTGEISLEEYKKRLKEVQDALGNKSPWKAYSTRISELNEKIKESLQNGDIDNGAVGEALVTTGDMILDTAQKADSLGQSMASMFNFDESEYKDVTKAMQGIGNIAKGIGQMYAGDYLGGIVNAASGVAGILETWSDSAYEAKERQRELSVLTDRLSTLNESINKLTEKLDEVYGDEALRVAEEARNRILETRDFSINTLRDTVFKKGIWDMLPGNRDSLAYRINEEYGREHMFNLGDYAREISGTELPEEMRTILGQDSWASLWSEMTNDEIAELLKDIKENHAEWWAEMINMNDGKGEEFFNSVIDSYEQLAEIDRKAKEQITQTSFDNVFDSFMSSLNDLANGSEEVFEDVAENWQKMVNKMVLYNLVGNKYKKELQKWYDQWEQVYSGDKEITPDEIAELRTGYDNIIKKATDEVKALREAGLVSPTEGGASDKKATYNFSDKVTYDQMDEFTGILRATQIAVEHGSVTRDLILANLDTLASLMAGNGTWGEIRNLIATSNDYLLDIKKSNREILTQFGDKMDDIIRKLEDLD